MNTRILLLVVPAVLPLAMTGCKNAPINGNADPRSVDVARAGRPGDPLLGTESGGLGPAAKEAVKYLPHGAAGASGPNQAMPTDSAAELTQDSVKLADRWRVGLPAWERGSQSDSPWDLGAWWDPYHQNVLKGDYPLPGTQNTFLNIEATSITLYENRKNPTPSGVFPVSPGNDEFFGNPHQTSIAHTFLLSLDLFHGETSFKPVDWRVFVRGATQANYAAVHETTALYADPSRGDTRSDQHYALQQAFFETTLAAVSPTYDVVQLRVGTQLFNSDFRGFLFFDEAPGVRLFGNLADNVYQWNLAYFSRLNKDTNSGLNTFDPIQQYVFIANIYRQDAVGWFMPQWKETAYANGLTTQLSFHWFENDESVQYDRNGFLVRPRLIGSVVPNKTSARWIGWTNDGHVNEINVNSALYHAWGDESFNEIAGRDTSIDAWMAALELSKDRDWMRLRVQGFWQSGDADPQDSSAQGFDAIQDNPNFAGGEFGFWNRNAVRLTGTGVGLVQPGSLLNSLRSSKIEGSPSFVNPGLVLLGVGWDAQITPHLKVITNASHLWFDDTSSIEFVQGQGQIDNAIGWDLSVGALWRPLLTDNVIVKGGVAALLPGEGFRNIYTAVCDENDVAIPFGLGNGHVPGRFRERHWRHLAASNSQ